MKITVKNPGIDYMIESILEFQSDDETAFWSDSLYYFYPQIDKEHARSLTFTKRKEYIGNCIRDIYKEIEPELSSKILLYEKYFQEKKQQWEEALSDAFDMDCSSLFNEIQCKISMNPISPRYLDENSYDVFYMNSERGALGMTLHEIIHFVWFYVWNQLFGDSYEEYERPSMKWILSEMVVETIMSDTRLSSLNPYYERDQGGCIYSYFFDMKVDNILILDTIKELYQENDIKSFMKKSYDFCILHESEIREHIEWSENRRDED